MKKRCIIISGGDYSPVPSPGEDDFVIACDRGYFYARRCGIRPDLLVSDFDSYDGPVDTDVPVNRFKPEKDDTDTMIAIRYAITHGFEEILLYCALGGRFDHAFANLQSAVFSAQHGVPLRILTEDTEIRTLKNDTLLLPRRPGWSLSVFSAVDECRGVSIRGAKYPLDKVTVSSAYPIGVSNEWAEDTAEISVEDGLLLVIQSRLS